MGGGKVQDESGRTRFLLACAPIFLGRIDGAGARRLGISVGLRPRMYVTTQHADWKRPSVMSSKRLNKRMDLLSKCSIYPCLSGIGPR